MRSWQILNIALVLSCACCDARAEDMLGEPVPVQRARVIPPAPLTEVQALERHLALCKGRAWAIQSVVSVHNPQAPSTYVADVKSCMEKPAPP